MKRKKLLPLAAAALACGVLIAAPQAASALAPDQAAPEVLGQANDYYYYEGDGYISYDDTYGYIRLDQDELYLTIPAGSSSHQPIPQGADMWKTSPAASPGPAATPALPLWTAMAA